MANTIPYAIPGFSDPISSWSHLLGAGASLVMTFFLVRRGRGDALRVFALAVFGFSCVFLLSMSGVFHLLPRDTVGREVLKRLDHAGIFLLIAGTFTPIHIILFRGRKRWIPVALVWTVAIAGITLKMIFFEQVPEGLWLFIYLGMGWLGAASSILLWRDFGPSAIELPAAGGIAYTLGACLEFFSWPVMIPGVLGPHELFHLFVLVGVACFAWFIWEIADAKAPGLQPRGFDSP